MAERPLIDMGEREFSLYALSLPRGPDLSPYDAIVGWRTQECEAAGVVMVNADTGDYGALVLRRQVDHRWTMVLETRGLASFETAVAIAKTTITQHVPPEPLAPGERRRPLLLKPGRSPSGKNFRILTETWSHYPAMMTVGEAYLAMPKPDANFVTDFQTANFNARLFELYLLAAFREQGVEVSQDVVSPDFHLQRAGFEAWVEAVAANDGANQGFTQPVHAPNYRERMVGAPAVRFAKTLRRKLQRDYHLFPHVQDKPFALALADYHAPGSMLWSREALPTYLYGDYAHVGMVDGRRAALSMPVRRLDGPAPIPAGIFRDPEFAHLSAVLFSNSATFGKFNRMGLLAGWRPPGLRMKRRGILFDRSDGALDPMDFNYDILDLAYEALWPTGERWSQELEVFHNPLAARPIDFELLPDATHWFEKDGEIHCHTVWANSVLASTTDLVWADVAEPVGSR
ncbi:hypothetical protein [Brevundimonas sp. ZS04]|uniref:hypothetical protein n=1 Tax=Brevundimonas sp. ZS04 TaxID=1906854 RepID=UPI00096E206D|nr:hypothetical protein [Brevundimonas sp. ZS04]OMG58188.1 hypothetical protein BJP32_10510 [Brevundimonas sp. ZS04]